MFSGYLNNIEATKETIDSDGWLHTGDIGHYDTNERLFITDRLKEVIKVGTLPVSPTEIEQFLLTHESVAEVAVVGVKHESESQWPRAYVKLKEGKSATEEELKKYVSGLNNL
jgi:acyl-CoA synthetase (AMP-forming)/AMP-acid ligase II